MAFLFSPAATHLPSKFWSKLSPSILTSDYCSSIAQLWQKAKLYNMPPKHTKQKKSQQTPTPIDLPTEPPQPQPQTPHRRPGTRANPASPLASPMRQGKRVPKKKIKFENQLKQQTLQAKTTRLTKIKAETVKRIKAEIAITVKLINKKTTNATKTSKIAKIVKSAQSATSAKEFSSRFFSFNLWQACTRVKKCQNHRCYSTRYSTIESLLDVNVREYFSSQMHVINFALYDFCVITIKFLISARHFTLS